MDKSVGELLADIRGSAYIDLFGLDDDKKAYFRGKNVDEWTHCRLFTNVLRSAELYYTVPRTGVTTTTLRVGFGQHQLIYGYIHSFGEPIMPQLYCFGGHFLSQDGEYRKDLVPVGQYGAAMELFAKPINMLIEHLRRLVQEGKITLTTEDYPKTNIDLGLLPYYVLAVAWFTDYLMIQINVRDKHLFELREDFILNLPGGHVLYSEIRAIPGFDPNAFFGVTKYPSSQPTSLNCGQKLIPLTITAVNSPYDLTLQVWREIHANEFVSQMVNNNICTGFAYSPGWFYISGSNERLYDGVASRRKYLNSKVAIGIQDDIKSAAEKTLHRQDQYPTNDPRHDIQSPINNHFAVLRKGLMGELKFTDANLVLSDYSICIESVHTNVTMGNIDLLARVYRGFNVLGMDVFSHILFDYLYDIYCLNHRGKIIQGDLHINNSTVMRLNMVAEAKYGYTAYHVAGEYYAFPYRGIIGCIIDFSRAVIGDTADIATKYSPEYAEMLRRHQTTTLLDLVSVHFPDIYRQYELRMQIVADDYFDEFFRVCTIIDVYSLIAGIITMFEVRPEFNQPGEKDGTKVGDDVRQLVQSIFDAAEAIFLSDMKDLLNDQRGPAELPLLRLIRQIFGEKRFSWPPTVDVTHVVNSENPLKYTDWNPLTNPAEEIKMRESLGTTHRFSDAKKKYVEENPGSDEIGEIAKMYARSYDGAGQSAADAACACCTGGCDNDCRCGGCAECGGRSDTDDSSDSSDSSDNLRWGAASSDDDLLRFVNVL